MSAQAADGPACAPSGPPLSPAHAARSITRSANPESGCDCFIATPAVWSFLLLRLSLSSISTCAFRIDARLSLNLCVATHTLRFQPGTTIMSAIENYQIPTWMEPYQRGERIGYRQAVAAYADYHCTDGSADMDDEIEERLPIQPSPMISYASRTGTKRNLEELRRAGWRLLVSAKGAHRTEGMRFAIDNGAWSAFTQGEKFDEIAFGKVVELLGEQADWIVLPDIVAGGMASLEFSLRWMERLGSNFPSKLLIAVQDGMVPDDVREYLNAGTGLFLGGTTAFKLASCHAWGALARRRNCHFHVGRVNSAKRIALCAAAGANSIDGTSATRFAKTIPRLSAAVDHTQCQRDMFCPSGSALEDTPFDCNWPSHLTNH